MRRRIAKCWTNAVPSARAAPSGAEHGKCAPGPARPGLREPPAPWLAGRNVEPKLSPALPAAWVAGVTLTAPEGEEALRLLPEGTASNEGGHVIAVRSADVWMARTSPSRSRRRKWKKQRESPPGMTSVLRRAKLPPANPKPHRSRLRLRHGWSRLVTTGHGCRKHALHVEPSRPYPKRSVWRSCAALLGAV